MRACVIALCSAILLVLDLATAAAQQVQRGTLRVTVVDATGAVIVGARVTITGIEPATNAVTREPVITNDQGIGIVADLPPGRYSVQAEFPGFQTRALPEVRVRNGDNRQVLALAIEAQRDGVVVQQDRQTAAADPRGPAFGTTLTREQLEALSDDPATLRQQLEDMAGPGAVIRVDSFEGAALPPKSQIRSIRISRDQFAAENHSAGGTQVEIITQPGLGPIRFNSGFRLRNDDWSGRSPFTETRGPTQDRNYFFIANGTLVPRKSSFNLFVNVNDSFETPNINVALGGATRSEPLRLQTPRQGLNVNANVDYAVTLDQTLRFGFNANNNTNRNLGIGAFDEEDRAFSTESSFYNLRIQQIGPLGRRAFLRTRLMLGWLDTDSRSAVEAVTIRVNDAFTRGGAQVAGGQHNRTFTLGGDIDYVRGLHSFRTGLELVGGSYRSNNTSNYLGTFTFESLDAYNAGRPRSYTRRVGDPNIDYRNLQGAVYLQDDVRVRRNLTLSAGIRYEAQTHVDDFNNVAPRFGVTWAPFAAGQTTLRGSWGLFSDWMGTDTFEQSLRVDGVRQQELNIQNPAYPTLVDPSGAVNPVNRYLLGAAYELPLANRASVGLDQRLPGRTQANITYAHTRGGALAHGINLNAPVNGLRPDPLYGNIVDVVSDASSRQNQVQVNITTNPGALLPLGARTPLVNPRRVTVFFNYTLSFLQSNTEGAFAISPTGTLDTEWGPASGLTFLNGQPVGDIRHRMNLTVNNQIVRNLLLSFNINSQSGMPYSIRTGDDNNSDFVFNDRPAGVGRNTERGAGQWGINTTFGYSFAFGPTPPAPPGIAVISGQVQTFDQGPRYRAQLFLNIQNLTNHSNYVGYVGTLSSPFFGQPTNVVGSRRVDFGINLGF